MLWLDAGWLPCAALWANGVGDAGVESLAAALEDNSALAEINLNNPMRGACSMRGGGEGRQRPASCSPHPALFCGFCMAGGGGGVSPWFLQVSASPTRSPRGGSPHCSTH
jgi:hypothetical protein